jgi:hypothetical protein
MPEVELLSEFGPTEPKKLDSTSVESGSVKIRISKRADHTFPFCRRIQIVITGAHDP